METSRPDLQFLNGGGKAGVQIATVDWAHHPMGAIAEWTPACRTALSMVLNSGFPSYLLWGPEFYVIYNDAYAPILGNKLDLGQGVPLRELWSEIADEACEIANTAFAGEPTFFKDRPFLLERFGRPGLAYFTFSFSPVRDEFGSVVGVVCTIVETTETVMAIGQLKESEERLKISLDASGSIGTWSYYPESKETFVDERFARLFQVDAALAQSGTELERFINMIHPGDRERVTAAIGHAIATGDLYNIDYRIPQLSGKIIWVTAKGKLFEDIGTGKKRFAGVAVDITELRESQEQLHQLAAELAKSNDRQTQFLATLAHELRNPLAPIRTGLELMRREAFAPQLMERLHGMMERQVGQLTHLIDDLMDVSRINNGKLELRMGQVDIRTAIQSAVETSMPQIKAACHELVMQLPDRTLLVDADATRLEQIFSNVLTNAAKYTPLGGRIEIDAHAEADNIAVAISDSGIGIAPGSLSFVFDMFSQINGIGKSQGGLGIGLSLVKRLVELHGGTVHAFSEGLGKGATFSIRLPVAAAGGRPAQQGTAATLHESSSGRIFRILVADDNEDAAHTLAALLRTKGHIVRIAADGEAALLTAYSFVPEVAFLDIGMPKKDGNSVAREMRNDATLNKTVLAAVSGWGSPADRMASKQAGFDHHLTKPVSLTDIETILNDVASKNHSR